MSVTSITIPELENFYDNLAMAIDEVGPEKTEIFLVKLALLLAKEAASKDVLSNLINEAAKDL